MFRIRHEQLVAMREARAGDVRRVWLQRFRARGLRAEEDPQTGAILLEDAAGGTAQVAPTTKGADVTSGEGRTFRLEHDSRLRPKAPGHSRWDHR